MNTTNQNNISTLKLLLAGVVPALLFCILFYDNLFHLKPFGLNVPLSLAAFYLLMAAAFGKKFFRLLVRAPFHSVYAVLLSITFVLFNDPVLLSINACLIILLVGEQIMLGTGQALYAPYSVHMVGDSLSCWFSLSFGGIGGAFRQYRNENGSRFSGILIGITIAVPILFAVIPLLLSGDAVFAHFFTAAFGSLEWGDIIGRVLIALALFVLFSGLFWSLANRAPRKPPVSAAPAAKKERTIPFSASLIILFALSAVLAVFCAIQFFYLFSSRVPAGVTYAEYARSGFWQLLGAAVIVMLTVLLLLRFGCPCTPAAFQLRRILAAFLLGCTLILLLSSFSRMTLYEQAFGFSQLRLFTQFFMTALFAFLIIVILRLWLPRIDLKKCAFFCFMTCYLILAFWNIDAFIARENIKNQGEKADISYLTTLSADALPYYIGLLDESDFTITIIPEDEFQYDTAAYQYLGNDRILLYQDDETLRQAWHLRRMMRSLESSAGDWRYFNVGREAAQEALAANPQLIENIDKIKEALTAGLS